MGGTFSRVMRIVDSSGFFRSGEGAESSSSLSEPLSPENRGFVGVYPNQISLDDLWGRGVLGP
jgi:hypothetical protein